MRLKMTKNHFIGTGLINVGLVNTGLSIAWLRNTVHIKPKVIRNVIISLSITLSYLLSTQLAVAEQALIEDKVDKALKAKPVNIVFIMADDLNDFIGVMNSDIGVKTPNIDRLAQRSTLFTNAHSNAPICSPSRASLFSGIYPHNSGQYAFGHWRKNEVLANSRTIMEQLSAHGYHSAGTGKLVHHLWRPAWDEFGIRPDYTPLAFNGKKVVQHPDIPSPYNTDIGPLDSTFVPLSKVPNVKATTNVPGYKGWYYGGFKKPFIYRNEQERDLLPDEMYADWTVNKISEYERKKIKKPFFLSVGFIRPHTPLVVPDRFFKMYPLDGIILPEFLDNDDSDTHFESIYAPKTSLGRKHYNTLVKSFADKETALKTYYQAYLASVSFMDEQVGKILNALEASAFKDNTIVVFTSDHGYHLGEKNNLFKNNLWERTTKVPLIVFDPRDSKKQTINAPVSLIDLYPTFMEYAGVSGDNRKNNKGKPLDGTSIKPLIDGHDSSERFALTVVKLWGENGMKNFAIRSKNWRYILYGNQKEELYHNKVDSKELTNLAGNENNAEIKSMLKKQLLLMTKNAK